MATRPKVFGVKPRAERQRQTDARRGSARDRGYDAAWDRARAQHLAEHPLCAYCAAGAWGEPVRVTAASLVDHVYPHRGDRELFWRRDLWASSCTPCHNGPKARAERRGRDALDALARLLGFSTLDPGCGVKG